MNVFRETLRRKVIESLEVQKLIGQRFYPSFLAEVKDPIFPCANFGIISGGSKDADIYAVELISFRIWTWSQKSLEEAYSIYDLIFGILHNTVLVKDSFRSLIKETARPFDNFDETSRTYYTMASWTGRIIS